MNTEVKDKPPELHPLRVANPAAKCPRHPHKDWRPLVAAAWAAGWWCRRGKKYIYCYSINGQDIVKVPMTPSDWRTIRNKRRDFRAAGLSL